MSDKQVIDFLYNKSLGIGGFPDSNVYIGTEFECCCHNDWGFVVIELNYDTKTKAYKRKVISGARKLSDAIEQAQQYYQKKHEEPKK